MARDVLRISRGADARRLPPPVPRRVPELLGRESSVITSPGRASRRSRRRLPVVLVLSDAITATLVVLLGQSAAGPAGQLAAFALPALWVLLVALSRGYESRTPAPGLDDLRRVGRAGVVLVVAGTLAGYAVVLPVKPEQLLLVGLATTGGSMAHRLLAAGWLRLQHRRADAPAFRIVVVGGHHEVTRAVDELHRSSATGCEVVAACTMHPGPERDLGVPVTSGCGDIPGVVARHRADAVVALPCPELDPRRMRCLGWAVERCGAQLFVGTGLLDVSGSRASGVRLGGLLVQHVRRAELVGPRRHVKDFWERPAAVVAVVLLTPLLVAIALAVRLDSPGPAVFRQQRIGRGSVPFTMLKFRTMTTDAEHRRSGLVGHNEADGLLFKVRDDPRVTRIGRVLRRYSLDELPQLLNVALGQMSLVGPRPPLPEEVAAYDEVVVRRLAVKPGVTGLWQVSGRSDLSWEESVRLDLDYVDNWCLAGDFWILARTVRAVLDHRGAY